LGAKQFLAQIRRHRLDPILKLLAESHPRLPPLPGLCRLGPWPSKISPPFVYQQSDTVQSATRTPLKPIWPSPIDKQAGNAVKSRYSDVLMIAAFLGGIIVILSEAKYLL
jgi:hypothetical protein